MRQEARELLFSLGLLDVNPMQRPTRSTKQKAKDRAKNKVARKARRLQRS